MMHGDKRNSTRFVQTLIFFHKLALFVRMFCKAKYTN